MNSDQVGEVNAGLLASLAQRDADITGLQAQLADAVSAAEALRGQLAPAPEPQPETPPTQ